MTKRNSHPLTTWYRDLPRRHRLRLTIGVPAGLLLLAWIALTWAIASRSHLRSPESTLLFEDHRGRYLAELSPDESRRGFWPLPETLPDRVAASTLAAEDHRFHGHGGIDFRSVARAVVRNFQAGKRLSGGSTLAMQVARLQEPGARTYFRKGLEAVPVSDEAMIPATNAQ